MKNPPADTGDANSIRGLGRSSGEGNGNPLQYSFLRNPLERDLQATVHEVAKSWTQLSTHTYTHRHTHTDLVYMLASKSVSWYL